MLAAGRLGGSRRGWRPDNTGFCGCSALRRAVRRVLPAPWSAALCGTALLFWLGACRGMLAVASQLGRFGGVWHAASTLAVRFVWRSYCFGSSQPGARDDWAHLFAWRPNFVLLGTCQGSHRGSWQPYCTQCCWSGFLGMQFSAGSSTLDYPAPVPVLTTAAVTCSALRCFIEVCY